MASTGKDLKKRKTKAPAAPSEPVEKKARSASSASCRASPAEPPTAWHGEAKCEECGGKAYYALATGVPRCGRHSMAAKKAGTRVTLPKNPKRAANRAEELRRHQRSIDEAAASNRRQGRPGRVTTFKLRMMRTPPLVPGFLNVFPNYRHQNRKDGWGCARLSPRVLGPVRHGQPGLPEAKTVEVFHQAGKVTAPFFDSDTDTVRPEFLAMQRAFYTEAFPYRHQEEFLAAHPELLPPTAGVSESSKEKKSKSEEKKKEAKQKKKKGEKKAEKNRNVPLFSHWVQQDGTVKRMTYVQSRQFYCHALEVLLLREPAWAELQAKIAQGVNICLCGFDAQPLEGTTFEQRYLDARRPFGHEDVIVTMLSVADPLAWPWRVHRTEDLSHFTVV